MAKIYIIFTDDFQILKNECTWLNERLITAEQRMLLESFPGTAGLHDMYFFDTLVYPCDPPKDLVQI